MNGLNSTWKALCLPAKVFPIIMTSLVLFDCYIGQYSNLVLHFVSLIVGTGLLYTLCAFNAEIVAWVLLGLPVVFFAIMFGLVILDLSLLKVTHTFQQRCYPHSVNGVPPPSCDSEQSA
jgi:hypothetical protein